MGYELQFLTMFNTIVGAGAVGAGAASRYGAGSDQKMRLLAPPAPQHCWQMYIFSKLASHQIQKHCIGFGTAFK
jgi:hypothetical protein